MKKFMPYILVIATVAAMLTFPSLTMDSARRAMELCGDIIIPSLFPFFVCSGLLIYSGLAESLSRFFRPVMKPLFNINSSGAAAFVLGIISGYPLGAVTACQLYESGYLSKSETERLLAFCSNSGPLFILGAVGTAMYSSRTIGVLLYSAHILAALTVGVLFRFYAPGRHSAPSYRINQEEQSFAEVFSRVLASSINSILTVCGAVIFFSVISAVVTSFIPEGSIARPLVTGILELTGGTKSISSADIPLAEKLVLSAFITGFAGICVHLQVVAIASARHLSLKPYLIGKAAHGLIAALYTLALLKLFPQSAAVFNSSAPGLDAGFCIGSFYSLIGAGFILAAGICAAAVKAGRRKKH